MYLPPAFDRSIALEAGALVVQAYAQYERGNAWSLPGNYNELGRLFARPEWKPAAEAFGFVARNRTSGLVFAVYRGTESPEDWIADFTFPQVAHPLGNVERGFADVYDQTAASVAAAIARAGGTPNVIVTGHSLGAALAVLAVAGIATSGAAAQTALYSFAGPRVGDLAFAAGFNSRVAAAWRIVNTEDIVTTVPLAAPALSSGIAPQPPQLPEQPGTESELRARGQRRRLHHSQGVGLGKSRYAGVYRRAQRRLIGGRPILAAAAFLGG